MVFSENARHLPPQTANILRDLWQGLLRGLLIQKGGFNYEVFFFLYAYFVPYALW